MTFKPKGILFDFNGTLFNDTRFHVAAWKNLIKKRFDLDLPDDEVRRVFVGPNNTAILRDILKVSDPALVLQYEREKEEAYREAAGKEPDLIPGVCEMFDGLVARGFPFCVATASPYENVRFYLDDLGLSRWMTIDKIVYEDGNRPGKPDPAFYIEAARRIGLTPEDCMIVEDSVTGIAAARNARAGRIVVIDTTTPKSLLAEQTDLHAVIHDFRNFEQFIE